MEAQRNECCITKKKNNKFEFSMLAQNGFTFKFSLPNTYRCTISSNCSEQEEKLSCKEITNQDNLAECPLLVFLDRKVDSL